MIQADHKEIAGKSAGEIARNISAFLSRTLPVQARREMDLANLLPDLNMKEQYSFAILMEAKTQGWEWASAENFYLRFCAPAVGDEIAKAILDAFRAPDGDAFRKYEEKYGCNFGLTSRAYWSSCFAVAVDAKAVPQLMEYFQSFVFSLLEFAYMGSRNPDTTYAWKYYDSFQNILTELTTPPDEIHPLKILGMGGTSGNRSGDSFDLTFGLDIHNPNATHMAWNTKVDVRLKDQNGKIITTVEDQVNCIDPNGIFHYGFTRRIRGNSVAHVSAYAKAEQFSRLSLPLMKHISMEKISMDRRSQPPKLNGKLKNKYDCPLYSYALHYQFLSPENKILGGGCEWFFEEFGAGEEKNFSISCPVPVKGAAKIVYSVDFNAQDLLKK